MILPWQSQTPELAYYVGHEAHSFCAELMLLLHRKDATCTLIKRMHHGFVLAVVGEQRSFGKRHEEHAKKAKEQSMEALKSQFYRNYPSKSAPLREGVRNSFFEDLQVFVGLGFSRQQPEHDKLVVVKGGMISWEGCILERLQWAKLGCDKLKDKQLHAVGYLFELCYDLALSSNHNLSQNPGFKVLLGVFHVDADE